MAVNQEQTITVADAPAIAGLSFRRWAGEADLPAMLAVSESDYAKYGEEHYRTLADLQNTYRAPSEFDPQRDVFLAEVNGEVIAYGRVRNYYETLAQHRVYVVMGYVKAEWQGRGLGTALLNQLETHARTLAQTQPQAERAVFSTWVPDKMTGRHALYVAAGFTPAETYYVLVRPLADPSPDLPLPDGIELRPVVEDHYRKIWDAEYAAFKEHHGISEPTAELYQQWLNDRNFQPELWCVAWDGEEVAGQILNFIDHNENEKYGRLRGYTEDISVGVRWRRRGLARALLARSLQVLKDAGMQEAGLGVHTTNTFGALNFYHSMGYTLFSTEITMEKPLD